MDQPCTGDKKLGTLFTEAWDLHHKIDNATEPSTSSTVQHDIDHALGVLAVLRDSVEQLDMFSTNEEIDEVVSSDLRFLLLAALTADLVCRKTCSITDRPELLQSAKKFYLKFFKICLDYNLGPLTEMLKFLQSNQTEKPAITRQRGQQRQDLQSLSAARDAKIAQHRRSKLRNEKLTDLEKHLHDEESMREYWLLQINKWIDHSMNEVTSLQTELQMLQQMETGHTEEKKTESQSKTPMKPFILTRDRLQASVFGAGYPSLPTVTLEEYFEREAAAGRMPDRVSKPASNSAKNEEESDDDDEEKLKKQRDMDDWKDTHRRGAGNRKNMG